MNGQLIFFLLLFVFVAIVFIVLFVMLKNRRKVKNSGKTILQITLPREVSDQNQDKKENLQNIQEKIGVMEAIYSNISGLKGMKNFSNGNLSFEIVVKKGVISFYIATPKKLEQFIIQQIQAQYPDAHIERRDDYNIFSPQGYIDGVSLKLAKNSLFPIKTYKDLQSDPLSALINTLSKIENDDGAVIQIITRPVKARWRVYGRKVATEVRGGKTLNEAVNAKGTMGSEFMGGIWDDVFKSFASSGKNQQESSQNTPKEPRRPSPMEEESAKKIEEKVAKAGLEVNIRIIVSADQKDQVKMYLDNIANSFGQYNIYEYGNSFQIVKPIKLKYFVNDFIYRNFNGKKKMILNSEELASIFHFPSGVIQTPNIDWLSSKEAPAPTNMSSEGIILGENVYRDKHTLVKLGREDRTRHTYVIGKSGVGKSELLSNMARQDILNGDGVCIIDPHGDFVDDILSIIPKERAEDVIYFNPADTERPMGLNLLEYDRKYPEQKTFVINEMIKIFDKLYDLKSTGGPMFEQYMRNTMLLIMDDPESGATLMEISKTLADPDFRKYKLSKCSNPVVKDFWQKEAEKAGGEASLANMVPYITSKLSTFVSNDIMRPIIGQQQSAFNLRKVMDEKKILLVNLSKGRIGEMNAYLLGMVLVGKILISALSRTDAPREERKDFYLYLDEFQNFITDSIAIILSEARKYRLNLNIAHQYIGQLVKNQDTSIRDSIFGNIGTVISFKVGADDAEFLTKEFAPVFSAHDLVNIDKFNAYAKLIIDNQPTRAFNMKTFPMDREGIDLSEQIKKISSLKYGKDRSIIEAEILKRINIQ